MSWDQVLGILRAIIAFAGGYAVNKGLTDEATVTSVGGAVIVIASAAWSTWANTQKAKIKSINNADNGVKVVANDAAAPASTQRASIVQRATRTDRRPPAAALTASRS